MTDLDDKPRFPHKLAAMLNDPANSGILSWKGTVSAKVLAFGAFNLT